MMRFFIITLCLLWPAMAQAGKGVKIVGSSTVAPFAEAVLEKLEMHDAILEVTGTSGGLSLFCAGGSLDFAPVALASRPIKQSEQMRCAANGVNDYKEVVLGRSGIVLITNDSVQPLHLTLKDIFLALAKQTPKSSSDCTLINNPRSVWRDVARSLPKRKIEVFGPPRTSGTRDSFIDMAMVGGALEIPCMRVLKKQNPDQFSKIVSSLRDDQTWIDAGENDAVIVGAVRRIQHAIGVVGYPVFSHHQNVVRAAQINNISVSIENINSGAYPLSRTLQLYVRRAALAQDPVLAMVIDEFGSTRAIGEGGYLRGEGLVPLNPLSAE